MERKEEDGNEENLEKERAIDSAPAIYIRKNENALFPLSICYSHSRPDGNIARLQENVRKRYKQNKHTPSSARAEGEVVALLASDSLAAEAAQVAGRERGWPMRARQRSHLRRQRCQVRTPVSSRRSSTDTRILDA